VVPLATPHHISQYPGDFKRAESAAESDESDALVYRDQQSSRDGHRVDQVCTTLAARVKILVRPGSGRDYFKKKPATMASSFRP
jgi:hypothetical protein